MTAQERSEFIARYGAGYDAVVTALDGISPAELDWKPAPSEWSAREVVHHLADSEMIAAVRLRRMLVEDAAPIAPYDPDELARRLAYAQRPHAPALALFQATRAATVPLLERMTDADWGRAGMHSKKGSYPVEQWLRDYAGHAHEHAEQIHANRAGFRGGK